MQTTQAVGGQLPAEQVIKPEQRGRHAAATQGLDAGPQGIARLAWKHQTQAIETNAGSSPGRRMGTVRRRDQHHGPAGSGKRRQRRQQEAEFADAAVFRQQLGQSPARPAAAGQLGIQPGEAGSQRRQRRHAEGIAAADVGALQYLGQCRVHAETNPPQRRRGTEESQRKARFF